MADAPLLSLQGIRLSMGGVDILRGVDLEVGPRGCHVLIGPNGAGKTSLFNVASGQYKPNAGLVRFEGQDITRMPPHQRARLRISRTFQVASLFRELTVQDNLTLAISAPAPLGNNRTRGQIQEQVATLLVGSGLQAKRHMLAGKLAYGEQRQLEIALGLASQPSLILMDEPMAGLSSPDRKALARRLSDLSRDMAILMVEHHLEDALAIADRITVLYLGEALFTGSAQEVRAHPLVQKIYLG
jgi:branched-chain amino acid transport system ATP-binding protein